jgi:hypothetical protein
MTAPMAAQAESPAKEFGMGVATVGVNLLYGPVKLLYALGGGMVATVAWAFSGGDVAVARPIVDASLRGDYFVSRDQLTGEDELEFIGRRPQHEVARDQDQGWDVAAPAEPEGF